MKRMLSRYARRTPCLRLLACGAVLLALAATADAEQTPIRIVTSIPPLAMLASEFGGDKVLSHSILPPGADAHTYELRPSDAEELARADVVVMLGSSIDDWLDSAIVESTRAVVVRLDENAKPAGAHAGEDDPHVWLDPQWVRERAVPAFQRALTTIDPDRGPQYGVAARAMAERLADLEQDIRASFENAPTRSFLAWHPAWLRFAQRFDLHSVGGVGEGEGREPSLRAMADTVRAARAAHVRAVLVEPQMDTRQASVLADEIGVPLVTVDPLGDAWSVDRGNYPMLMKFNVRAFGRALGVEQPEKEKKDP